MAFHLQTQALDAVHVMSMQWSLKIQLSHHEWNTKSRQMQRNNGYPNIYRSIYPCCVLHMYHFITCFFFFHLSFQLVSVPTVTQDHFLLVSIFFMWPSSCMLYKKKLWLFKMLDLLRDVEWVHDLFLFPLVLGKM